MRWFTTDEADHSARGQEQEAGIVSLSEWYVVENTSSMMGSVRIMISKLALYPFNRDLPWPCHRLFIN